MCLLSPKNKYWNNGVFKHLMQMVTRAEEAVSTMSITYICGSKIKAV